jgi:hypothetical protein
MDIISIIKLKKFVKIITNIYKVQLNKIIRAQK